MTVQQPWAWAIVHGGKDVENRTQAWTYRGALAIHAGARLSERGLRAVPDIAAAEQLVDPDMIRAEMRDQLVTGTIIGVVDLVDVHYSAGSSPDAIDCCDSWWAEASYDEHGGRTRRDVVHLVLEHPRPVPEPIACKGRLGLWTPPVEVLEQLQAVTR
nr:ASCH domain-containing protein [Nocardioides lijunqiniae]